ncbi:MAG: FeoA family protein [Neisseria sp.]|nr:FeoA family protein [Neisseria sp.]
MTILPLSRLRKGASVHIHTIAPNPAFGHLDTMVSRRLADLGFSDGMPLLLIACGVLGKGPFAVRLGNQAQFSLRQAEAAKIICRLPE